MFALHKQLPVVVISLIIFFFSHSAQAEICWEPQVADEPVSDGGDSKVKKNNKGGKGKKSGSDDITTQHSCGYPTPTPPTPSTPGTPSASVTYSSSGSYTVSWSASSNMKTSGSSQWGYELMEYRNGSYVKQYKTSPTTTSQAISGNPEGDYRYKVRGCNSDLNTGLLKCSSYSSLSSTNYVRKVPAKPNAPSTVPTQNSTGGITVSWTKPSGTVTHYMLQKRKNSGSWIQVFEQFTNGAGEPDIRQEFYNKNKTISSLSDGSWDFRVRACNGSSSCSSYSSDSSNVTVRKKPSNPYAPKIDSVDSTGAIDISWSKPSGTVTKYDIREYRGGALLRTLTTSALSLSLSGRADGSYTYKVRACNGYDWACSGFSSHSSSAVVLHKPGTPASITGPTGLDEDGTFTISWGSATGQVAYYQTAERHKPISGAFGGWKYIKRGLNQSNGYASLEDGEWDFAVRACNASGCSGWRYINPHIQVLRVPGIPSSISATNITDSGNHTISWGVSSGNLITYKLYQRLKPYNSSSYNSWGSPVYTGSGNSKSFSNRADGDWDYRVKACNDAGCSGYRTISPKLSVLKPPSAPTNVSVDQSSDDGSYTLTWNTASGIVDEYIYSESPNFDNWQFVGMTLGAEVSGKGDGTWSYKVKACNATSCSASASSNSVTVNHPTPDTPAAINVPSLVTKDTYTISWEASSSAYADDYQVAQKHESGSWSGWNTVSGLSTSVTVSEGGLWTHRVRACNLLPDDTRKCSSTRTSSPVDVQLPPDWGRGGGDVADKALTSKSLGTDQTVGAINGEGNVSGGAATYSIPIKIPQGRKGVQPNVSLNYSSRTENGIAGMGWSLSAGSNIHRCGSTIAQDGITQTVSFSVADKLCLDGQRLFTVDGSTYGSSNAQYRTELDSYSRVKQYGSLNGSSPYFVVEHKDGRISTYGGDSQSRHKLDGRDEVLSWAISEVQDRSGNTITYSYSDLSSGEHRIKSISYTGSTSTLGNRQVEFKYEDRPDKKTKFLAGGMKKQTKRLKWIITKYKTNVIRNYELLYSQTSNTTGASLLTSIEECGYSEGSQYCLPVTSFSWNNPKLSTKLEKVPLPSEIENGSLCNNTCVGHEYSGFGPRINIRTLPDLTGDGQPEVLVEKKVLNDDPNCAENPNGCLYYYTDYYLVKTSPEGNYTDVMLVNFDMGADFSNSAVIAKAKGRNVFDINKDGKSDLFTSSNGVVEFLSWKGGDAWDINSFESYKTAIPIEHGEIPYVRDFNNDGKFDVLLNSVEEKYSDGSTAKKALYLYLNNGTYKIPSFSSPVKIHQLGEVITSDECHICQPYRPPRKKFDFIENIQDIDGDGFQDIILGKAESIYLNSAAHVYDAEILVNKFNDNSSSQSFELSYFSSLGIDKADDPGRNFHLFMDVNADGLQDYLFVPQSTKTWWLKVNNGDGFNTSINLGTNYGVESCVGKLVDGTPCYQAPKYIPKYSNLIMPFDIKQDGVLELLVRDETKANHCYWASSGSSGTEVTQYRVCSDPTFPYPNDAIEKSDMYTSGNPAHDRGLYSAGMISFDVSSKTNINAVTTQSDLIFTPYGVNSFTLTNDGLSQLGLLIHPQFTGSLIYQEPGVYGSNHGFYVNKIKKASGHALSTSEKNLNVITRIADGLENLIEWTYLPLNSYGDIYSTDFSYLNGEPGNFHFQSSMYVVAEQKVSNGVGGNSLTKYKYRGAVYNDLGRGFQGFRTIIVDDLSSGIRSVSKFHQKFPLAGKLDMARTCLIVNSNSECEYSPISVVDYDWRVWRNGYISNQEVVEEFSDVWTVSPGARYGVAPYQSLSESYDLNNGTHLYSNLNETSVNGYGNVTFQRKTYFEPGGINKAIREADYIYYPADETSWSINLLKSKTVTAKAVQNMGGEHAPVASGTNTTKSVKTTYVYNDERLPETITTTPVQGGGQSSSVGMTYTAYGLPKTVTTLGKHASGTLMLARTVSTTYSSDGYFPKEVTNAKGHKTTTVIDAAHGQPLSVTDANGVLTTNGYDAFGRLISTTTDGAPTIYKGYKWCSGVNNGSAWCPSYDYAVYRVTQVQAGNPTVHRYFDRLNREVTSLKRNFQNTNWLRDHRRYDERGLLAWESKQRDVADDSAYTYTYYDSYDALGRLLEKRTPQANGGHLSTSYYYDGLVTEISAGSLSMKRKYNGLSQLVWTEDAMQGMTRYAYDGAGNPISLQDANSHTIHAWHNALGHKTKVNDPNMGIKTFGYNTFGEVELETDANGDTLTMDYDVLGRLTTREVNNTLASFSYDSRPNGKGLLASESAPGVDKLYSYDENSRPKTVKTTIDGVAYTTTTEYDVNYGRVKALAYPSGIKVAYDYTDTGYLLELSNARTGYSYQKKSDEDAYGNVTGATLADETLSHSASFHPATGQMTGISVKRVQGASPLHQITYQYNDEFSNLTQQVMTTGSGAQSTESYDYDPLHRLTLSVRNLYSGSVVPAVSYSYDAVGNLISKSDYAGTVNYGNLGKGNTANAGPNAVQSILKDGTLIDDYEYDNNGNMLSGDGKTIHYNAFNKPISVSKNGVTSTFEYGADLSRFKQTKGTETTLYIDKLVEINKKGNTTTTKTYIGDVAIVEKEEVAGAAIPNHNIRFVHRDRLGSVVTLTDHNNQILEHRSYDPFGKPRTGDFDDVAIPTLKEAVLGDPHSTEFADKAPFTNRGFTDHEHLDDAELIHMNGRAYDYNLGRFLSVDPFIQEPGNSQSMNPYSYVLNNPLAYTDPSGYRREPGDAGAFLGNALLVATGNRSVGDAQKIADVESAIGNDSLQGSADLGESIRVAVTTGSVTTAIRAVEKKVIERAKNNKKTKKNGAGQKLKNREKPAGAPKTKDGNCSFDDDTLISIKGGHKRIIDLEIGDQVLARDDDSLEGQTIYKTVTKTFKDWHDSVIELVLVDSQGNEELLITTSEHPFYIIGHGWLDAASIDEGSEVATSKNTKSLTVRSKSIVKEGQYAYNITVADYHTFFVSDSGAWVHNFCDKKATSALESSKAKRRASREAQRQAGIPTSRSGANSQSTSGVNQPRHQVKEGADGKPAGVFDGRADTNNSSTHSSNHVEAGKIKGHGPATNKHGAPRLKNGKSKVEYGNDIKK